MGGDTTSKTHSTVKKDIPENKIPNKNIIVSISAGLWDPQRQALPEVTSPGWSLQNVKGWSLRGGLDVKLLRINGFCLTQTLCLFHTDTVSVPQRQIPGRPRMHWLRRIVV